MALFVIRASSFIGHLSFIIRHWMKSLDTKLSEVKANPSSRAFIIADANRSALEPSIKELGLSAWAVDATPTVPTHDLDVPRIGYIHSWTCTQD